MLHTLVHKPLNYTVPILGTGGNHKFFFKLLRFFKALPDSDNSCELNLNNIKARMCRI